MAGPDLLPYAITDRQREILEAVAETGGYRPAARKLGCHPKNVHQAVEACRKRAARQGYAPEHDLTHTVPDGFMVKGASTLYDADTGVPKLQWVKSSIDRERQWEITQEAIRALCDDLPKLRPRRAAGEFDADLMTVLPIADMHIGSYVYGPECGDDYDTPTAVRLMCGAVDYLVKQGPRSKRCVIINLGDLYHADNKAGVTERSGHVLHLDTRMSFVIESGMKALRQCVESALDHHETVDLINVHGNHDDILGSTLRVAFKQIYENVPRVRVHDSPASRQYLQHGKVLIGAVHGHQTKDKDLPGIMAAERPEQWGQTRHRYFYRGHYHHDRVEEMNGCKVEMFRTLAAGDNYAVESGYLAGRDMKSIVMHKEYGEVSRTTCALEMLKNQV